MADIPTSRRIPMPAGDQLFCDAVRDGIGDDTPSVRKH